MVKKMLINAAHAEECRVAVVVDGLLDEYDVQLDTHEATQGNIYKGRITRVEPSLQAAFVDYGSSRNGFLSISDVHPSYFPESFVGGRRRPRMEEVFRKDDEIIVQVTREPRDNKGAGLTTNISLPGRYLVLMPGTELHGVSRKIEDEKERDKLKEIVKQLTLPEKMGFIVRTAGMGRTKAALERDINYLLKLWRSIEKNVQAGPAPSLLYKEQDLVIRSIRDHFSPDISEILVDDPAVYKKSREFFAEIMPKYEKLVKLYQEKRPLFNKYQLEEQVEQVYRKRINLKSGGSIIIEPTEALVTIDVNSGGSTAEKGIEETAFKVNMEAAEEIARQLRLRDLGGIIVIDFIDMMNKHHNQEVEKTIKNMLKADRARTKVLRISALGLLELSRQRMKPTIGTGEYLTCPTCEGHGKIRSPETAALSVFRRMKSLAIRPDVAEVNAIVPSNVAEYILNNLRSLLVTLEEQHRVKITVRGRERLPHGEISVEAVKKEAQPRPEAERDLGVKDRRQAEARPQRDVSVKDALTKPEPEPQEAARGEAPPTEAVEPRIDEAACEGASPAQESEAETNGIVASESDAQEILTEDKAASEPEAPKRRGRRPQKRRRKTKRSVALLDDGAASAGPPEAPLRESEDGLSPLEPLAAAPISGASDQGEGAVEDVFLVTKRGARLRNYMPFL
jgi:ribonuclease E